MGYGVGELSANVRSKQVIYVAGSVSGICLCAYLYKKYQRSRQAAKFSNVTQNGHLVHSKAEKGSQVDSDLAGTNQNEQAVVKVPRNQTGAGLALLLDEDKRSRRSLTWDDTDTVSSNGRIFSQRRRTESMCSGTTTLMLTTRSPSELLLYGLESLKRAIRLWEESRNRLSMIASSSDVRENSVDSELEFILCKAKQLVDDVEDYRREVSPKIDSIDEDREDSQSMYGSERSFGASTTLTLPFYDIEPNIHFFKLYTQAIEELPSIEKPRIDRSIQLCCESSDEFTAKVHCLRLAFVDILSYDENMNGFVKIAKEILEVILSHSSKEQSECMAHFEAMLEYVSDVDNHDSIVKEIAARKIPYLSFYDLVLDYVILESFDDLDNPPSAVQSVAGNRWLSAGFKELALQTAVSAVLRHKRSKLTVPDGFFAHFYNIMEHISPILAWGFLGTDYDLKFKCNIIKESVLELIRGYFSFDRVRYTSMSDLTFDIMQLTDFSYTELQDKLSICK
ncbi:hypothetical protein HDE_08283 [Halotydeus destructor]|nr:hypothetical protein HDE_08283 [Halotydeus destructor]